MTARQVSVQAHGAKVVQHGANVCNGSLAPGRRPTTRMPPSGHDPTYEKYGQRYTKLAFVTGLHVASY